MIFFLTIYHLVWRYAHTLNDLILENVKCCALVDANFSAHIVIWIIRMYCVIEIWVTVDFKNKYKENLNTWIVILNSSYLIYIVYRFISSNTLTLATTYFFHNLLVREYHHFGFEVNIRKERSTTIRVRLFFRWIVSK